MWAARQLARLSIPAKPPTNYLQIERPTMIPFIVGGLVVALAGALTSIYFWPEVQCEREYARERSLEFYWGEPTYNGMCHPSREKIMWTGYTPAMQKRDRRLGKMPAVEVMPIAPEIEQTPITPEIEIMPSVPMETGIPVDWPIPERVEVSR